MAHKNHNNAVKQEKVIEQATEKPKKEEIPVMYTIEEFANAPKSVGTESPDIVRAALTMQGKDSFTVKEATELVKKFSNKEVK